MVEQTILWQASDQFVNFQSCICHRFHIRSDQPGIIMGAWTGKDQPPVSLKIFSLAL